MNAEKLLNLVRINLYNIEAVFLISIRFPQIPTSKTFWNRLTKAFLIQGYLANLQHPQLHHLYTLYRPCPHIQNCKLEQATSKIATKIMAHSAGPKSANFCQSATIKSSTESPVQSLFSNLCWITRKHGILPSIVWENYAT